MGNLPDKKLSVNEVYYLLNCCKISKGGEAVVCEGSSDYSVYKLFTKDFQFAPMSENKEKKITFLHQLDLDYSNKILSSLSCNGQIIGYEATTDPFFDTYKLHDLIIDDEELLHYLKRTREILDYFRSKGVIYVDFDPRNTLINRSNGEIMFCDMDNVEVGGYPVDAVPWDAYEYKQLRGIDYGIHPYMHNVVLLRALSEDIYTISNSSMRRHFKLGAYRTLKSMQQPEYFNDGYLIDYIKKPNR